MSISPLTNPPNFSLAGKNLVSPVLSATENVGVFIVAGQSNCVNSANSNYTPTGRVHNLSINDGQIYVAADPLLGCSGTGGTWIGRLGDKLIANGIYDRVIFIPVGIGATYIEDWETGFLSHRINQANDAAESLGFSVSAVLWQQGESEALGNYSQSYYQTALGNLISNIRSLGCSARWFIAKTTIPGVTSTSNIRAAQTGIVDENNLIFAGPDSDTITGVSNRFDGAHFTAAGSDANATLWLNALNGKLPGFRCSGGSVLVPGDGFKYHTFSTNGTLVVSGDGSIEYLVVGPGGPGGGCQSGGIIASGGAGSEVVTGTINVSNQSISITIGSRGTPGAASNTTAGDGVIGTATVFGSISAQPGSPGVHAVSAGTAPNGKNGINGSGAGYGPIAGSGGTGDSGFNGEPSQEYGLAGGSAGAGGSAVNSDGGEGTTVWGMIFSKGSHGSVTGKTNGVPPSNATTHGEGGPGGWNAAGALGGPGIVIIRYQV